MRILYIDVNCKQSSTGQIAYNLFCECKRRGFTSAVCYGRGKKIHENNVFKFGLDWETFLHLFLTRITGFTGCFSYFSTKRLIKFIKKFNPDVVHIQELHAYFVNIKMLLQYLKNNHIKTVFTNQCEFLYTGKCGHGRECSKYSLNCGKCPHVRGYPKSLLFDHTSKMLKQKRDIFSKWNDAIVVAPSSWIKKRMEISFFKNKNIYLINNGIDTHFFGYRTSNLRDKYNIPKSNKIILTAAPSLFSDLKGGYRFFDIANYMQKKYNNLTFIAIGKKENEVIKDIPSNTIILPLIRNKDELIEFYSLADCFVICSNNENYPTTSLEAQCCGTKVVGYDVGGVGETILDNNGCVAEYNNVEAISKEIFAIINENYDKMAISNIGKANFSVEKMFDRYLVLYRK